MAHVALAPRQHRTVHLGIDLFVEPGTTVLEAARRLGIESFAGGATPQDKYAYCERLQRAGRVDRMVELGQAKAGQKAADLGSGDGRIVVLDAAPVGVHPAQPECRLRASGDYGFAVHRGRETLVFRLELEPILRKYL